MKRTRSDASALHPTALGKLSVTVLFVSRVLMELNSDHLRENGGKNGNGSVFKEKSEVELNDV